MKSASPLLVTMLLLFGAVMPRTGTAARFDDPSPFPGGEIVGTEGEFGATLCVSHSKCTDAFSAGSGLGCQQLTGSAPPSTKGRLRGPFFLCPGPVSGACVQLAAACYRTQST
jgi:hypothetical protein